MFLNEIRPHLIHALRSPRAAAQLEEARQQHELLAGYANVLELVRALECRSRSTFPHREALIRVLIEEAQRDSRGPWSSLLVVAFLPMLSHLRNGLRGEVLDADDLDQLVFACFLDVVAAYRLAVRLDRTAMYLRQDTRRAVLAILGREQRRARDHANLETVARQRFEDPVRMCESGDERNEEDERELAELLDAQLEATGTTVHRELVVETTLGGRSLARFVAEQHPATDGEERKRVYNRLKRRRERTIHRVADALRSLIAATAVEAIAC